MRTWYSSESRTECGVKPHIGASPSSLNIRGLYGHMQYSLSELWQMPAIITDQPDEKMHEHVIYRVARPIPVMGSNHVE
ncbi:hypothetical protein AVEN_120847-1 [Araneus ventricosus]|uniref:Uncharacterized protein n=1 Tax=Araneus ventricosus TaxID=182803 RepID=A0A4Y2TZS7_ARAVE|nr:hypothetical protein AVEN_104702-1 [Araneus ventricosus]GBO05846.1 hypothetical protein AVEN_120847-1 [Araneus ventricosus]